jgi:hypothetical protein
MSRQSRHERVVLLQFFSRTGSARRGARHARRQSGLAGDLSVERLEERWMMAADSFEVGDAWAHAGDSSEAPILAVCPPAPSIEASTSGGGGAEVAANASVDHLQLDQIADALWWPFGRKDDTFDLHSNPKATKVIYLDFDGHKTKGTDWNDDHGLKSIVTPAFSLDGSTKFSDLEKERIRAIWERVAEDFRPFDVDVTTEDPGENDLKRTGRWDREWGIRVAIGGSTFDWFTPTDGREVGGVAYVGSFTWDSDTPCFAFSADFGDNEKGIAEVITHEVGHTLGLSHDGLLPDIEYYYGHGTGATGWAPIMGVGYDSEVVQWSQGEYPDANQPEDDLAIITSQNGFGYRRDDHGDRFGTANRLKEDDGSFVGSGIIERNTDVDFFRFRVREEGTLSLDVSPFYRGPNLDILATLYDEDRNVIATSNPIDALWAGFNLSVLEGTYYVSIDGTGKPAAGDDYGYSDYGSLGAYSITATLSESLTAGLRGDRSYKPVSRSNLETGGTYGLAISSSVTASSSDSTVWMSTLVVSDAQVDVDDSARPKIQATEAAATSVAAISGDERDEALLAWLATGGRDDLSESDAGGPGVRADSNELKDRSLDVALESWAISS